MISHFQNPLVPRRACQGEGGTAGRFPVHSDIPAHKPHLADTEQIAEQVPEPLSSQQVVKAGWSLIRGGFRFLFIFFYRISDFHLT